MFHLIIFNFFLCLFRCLFCMMGRRQLITRKNFSVGSVHLSARTSSEWVKNHLEIRFWLIDFNYAIIFVRPAFILKAIAQASFLSPIRMLRNFMSQSRASCFGFWDRTIFRPLITNYCWFRYERQMIGTIEIRTRKDLPIHPSVSGPETVNVERNQRRFNWNLILKAARAFWQLLLFYRIQSGNLIARALRRRITQTEKRRKLFPRKRIDLRFRLHDRDWSLSVSF